MNRLERMKEIVKVSPNFGKGVGLKMCVVDELHDIKELEEKLKWSDLKKGDLIRHKTNGKVRRVSRVDRNDWRGFHIFVKEGYWLNDFELEKWEKAEK